MSKILFGLELGPSVADPRLHHQLLPNSVSINNKYKMRKAIVDGLKAIGHEVKESTFYSVVQAIYRENPSTISAMSDPRKKGKPAGY